MTFRGKPRDPSRSMLDQVESDLNKSIQELCHVDDVREESTGEMERLSDQLLDAARRAHVAAELRRTMRQRTLMEHIRRRHGGEDLHEKGGEVLSERQRRQPSEFRFQNSEDDTSEI